MNNFFRFELDSRPVHHCQTSLPDTRMNEASTTLLQYILLPCERKKHFFFFKRIYHDCLWQYWFDNNNDDTICFVYFFLLPFPFVYSTPAVILLLSTKAKSSSPEGFFSDSFLTHPVAALSALLLIKLATGPGMAPFNLTSQA